MTERRPALQTPSAPDTALPAVHDLLLLYDFLHTRGGAERVLHTLYSHFPAQVCVAYVNAASFVDEFAPQDLIDLGVELPAPVAGAVHTPNKAQALGWVFVSEGSKLGAGVLIKQARLLGLSETHGARHMGEPAEGRGRNWKSFIEMLDAVELTPEEDAQLEQAANDAFSRFTFLLEQTYVKQTELA